MSLPFEQLRERLPSVLPANLTGRLLGTTGIALVLGGVIATAYTLRETQPRIVAKVQSVPSFPERVAVALPPASPAVAAPASPAPAAAPNPFTDKRSLTPQTSTASPPPASPPSTPQPVVTSVAAATLPAQPATPTPPPATPPPTSTVALAVPPPTPVQPPAPRFGPNTGCGQATVSVTPRDAGIMGLRVESLCRAGEFMQIRYGGVDLIRRIGDSGVLYVDLDLFAGVGKAVDLVFHDGTRKAVPADAKDMDRVSKVALLWSRPINLDLHAFEFGAAYGEPGHRWSRLSTDGATVLARVKSSGRGEGFVSTAADGTGTGVHLEVYTYIHGDNDSPGHVAMAIDYETRGDMPAGDVCGSGQLANIGYDFRALARDGQTAGGTGTIRAAQCSVPMAQTIRYQQAGLPTLRIRKP